MGKKLAEPASSLPIPVPRRIQEPPAILERRPASRVGPATRCSLYAGSQSAQNAAQLATAQLSRR